MRKLSLIILLGIAAVAFVRIHITAAGGRASAAVTPTQTITNVLDTMPVGEWYPLANTQVRNVIYQFPAGTFFGNTVNMRFLVESGGSYDSTRNRMIVWGGGHGDYAGNEIYTFD